MKKDVFEFRDYKSFLKAFIKEQPRGGRGVRMAMARAAGCPVSHVSQILTGKSHLSFEQAEGLNAFFGHTQEQSNFFFLLIQMARAGTPALRDRLHKQMQSILEKRLVLKERLGVKQSISEADQATFYSSWLYGAVHVLLTIPEFQSVQMVAQKLRLSMTRANEIVEFLQSIGLVTSTPDGRIVVGTTRIHLGSDSPLIAKFHTNWRIKSIQSLEKENFKEDLHYSSAITVSKADALMLKESLIKKIEEVKTVIRDSPAEELHCFSLDFFSLE